MNLFSTKVDLRNWVIPPAIEHPSRGRKGTQIKYLDWVIAGCESGPGARSMDLDWARSLRDQCQAAGVPFFFKQAKIDGKLVKMPLIDGKIWDEIPNG